MEQYIYIFTIILEIIVAFQIGFAILKADKKVLLLNKKILEYKDVPAFALKKFRNTLEKFNKIAGFIIKFKNSTLRKVVMQVYEIAEIFLLLKSLKNIKKLSKYQLLRKFLSFSFIKNVVCAVKQFV